MPVQGLAAHIIGDSFPADVRVDVVVRQVLWWHRAQRHVSPPSPDPVSLPPHHSSRLTRATGAVHAALLAEVQGEGGAAEAVERAFSVHTLTVLTGHVLALVVICGGREVEGMRGAVRRQLARRPASWKEVFL